LKPGQAINAGSNNQAAADSGTADAATCPGRTALGAAALALGYRIGKASPV